MAHTIRIETFQFTLPRGERHLQGDRAVRLEGFNSRSREGSDIKESPFVDDVEGFNSRSREGSDFHQTHSPALLGVSIHAPARGATK